MADAKHRTDSSASAAGEGPRQKAVMELIRTTDQLRRYFTALYEPHGITPQQYNVLRILRGVHPEALPTMTIAERMIEQAPGITRLLDRLEEKRLVMRTRPPDDRRRVLISITSEGLSLLEILEEPVRDATVAVVQDVAPEELERLNAVLSRIRRAL